MKYHPLVLIVLSVVLAACSETDSSKNKTVTQTEMKTDITAKHTRNSDFAQITRGAKVFQQNCASCHGARGEGKAPAPPLNGTGHAWHHSSESNRNTILNGTKHLGGTMPGWKDKLSDQEVADVMAWFQSKWSDEIYQLWYQKVESKSK